MTDTLVLHSDKLDLLLPALHKSQLKSKAVLKDAENPFFHSKYAKLENYIEAFNEYYAPHDLTFTQTLLPINDKNFLVTTLWHVSGQWVRSYYPLLPTKPDPQTLGGCVTYAKRYALSSITGLPETDDDGEGAMHRNNAPLNQSNPKKPPITASSGSVSEAQVRRLWAIAHKQHWKQADVKKYASELGLRSEVDMTHVQYEHFCNLMQKFPKEEVSERE